MIEVVRGRLTTSLAQEVLSFWRAHGVLSESEAQRRLAEVVCVSSRDGAMVGVNSAYETELEVIGGRRFWIYRSFLLDPATDAEDMLGTAFDALEAAFDRQPGSPVGLCVLGPASGERDRPVVAPWSHPHMIHAGYLPDGRQLYVGYFSGADISREMIRPGATKRRAATPELLARIMRPVESGYRVEAFSEQSHVSADDIVELWTEEAGLPPGEARRRVEEVTVVALGPDDGLAGISTAYLQPNRQLGAELWHVRLYAALAHRSSNVGVLLGVAGMRHVSARHASGGDTRGVGLLYEVENAGLRRRFSQAHGLPLDFTFIGENARGHHVRVHYFPGAVLSESPMDLDASEARPPAL